MLERAHHAVVLHGTRHVYGARLHRRHGVAHRDEGVDRGGHGQVVARVPEREGTGRGRVVVLEDAAHAVETRYKGELIGHHPRGTVSYSFYATKNLACGEGGALVTDDDEIARRAQVLSSHGMSAGAWNRYGKEGSWRYDIEEPGYKYNMFDIQAALALTQLARMEDMQRRRFEAVRVYEEAFRDVPQLRLQKTPAYCHHSRHLYVMRIVPERLTISRDAFIEELKSRNVGVSVHFIALHTMSAYVKRFGYKPEDFPKAYAFSESEISLPMYSTLGVQNAQYVAQAVLDVVRRYAK